MKKTQKNVLGTLGLILVAAVTTFAAYLPGPEASATSSLTDHITVRVVAETANVDVSGIVSGSTLLEPDQNVTISHENVDHLRVTIKYTDKNDVEHTYILVDEDVDSGAWTKGMDLNLKTGEYTYRGNTYTFPEHGYGDYVITVYGEGTGGTDEQNLGFKYIPVIAEVVTDSETGNPHANLDYLPDDGTETSVGNVASLTLNVYDKDGNLVTPMSPITVTAPTDGTTLPFDQYNLPSGEYTLEVIAHDKNGVNLYKPYYVDFTYQAKEKPNPDDEGGDEEDIVVPDTGAPDTGGLFGNLNVSKADFLITGLIIFFAVGIGGAIFIARRNKKPFRR